MRIDVLAQRAGASAERRSSNGGSGCDKHALVKRKMYTSSKISLHPMMNTYAMTAKQHAVIFSELLLFL